MQKWIPLIYLDLHVLIWQMPSSVYSLKWKLFLIIPRFGRLWESLLSGISAWADHIWFWGQLYWSGQSSRPSVSNLTGQTLCTSNANVKTFLHIYTRSKWNLMWYLFTRGTKIRYFVFLGGKVRACWLEDSSQHSNLEERIFAC